MSTPTPPPAQPYQVPPPQPYQPPTYQPVGQEAFAPPPPPPGQAPAQYASIGARAAAIIIDTIILAVIVLIIFFAGLGSDAASDGTIVYYGVFELIVFALGLGYFTYFEGTTGQTLGKKLLHIKVVRLADGQHPNFMEALIRTVCRIIDGIAIYLIGFIIAYVSDKKQRLGDIAAHTIVINA
jgi:uncharacterized RDD family membrane protein YckC